MNLKRNLIENWRPGAVGAGSAALLGLCFLIFPVGESLTNLSYDLPFAVRPDIEVGEVRIVYMDEDSHINLKQPWNQPWDRTVHARLIERLTECGAKAIAFDVLFDIANTNSPADIAADQRLIRAAQAHGKVVFGAKAVPNVVAGEIINLKLTAPFPDLRKYSFWGVVESSGEDKTIRRHFPGALGEPSMAWRVAQLTMDQPPDPSAPRWVNYYGPPGSVPYRSYYQVFNINDTPAAYFSNKVVYVGALFDTGFTGGKGTDDFRTPYSRWTQRKSAGVEVNATAYLNLLRGDSLKRPSPVVECLLFALIGGFFGYILPLLKPWVATRWALGSVVVVAVAAYLVFCYQHAWFPWLIVCAVQIPCALAWSVLANTKRVYREKEVLEKTIATVVKSGLHPPGQTGEATPVIFDTDAIRQLPAGIPPMPVPGSAGALAGAGGTILGPVIPDHGLVRCVGRGSYGEVWLAKDVIGSYHAVKVVYRRTFSNDGPFDREFKGIQKFTPISRSHPGFVHILHVGRNDAGGYFFYIMEVGDDEAAGQKIDPQTYSPKNLSKELQRRGKLPLDECLQLSVSLADALEYLHKNQLIHRDIKPSNIIFVNDVPKFADIGLVTDLGAKAGDATYLGTEGYIAPEGPGTAAADVYSLGKLIYEVSMGLDRGRFPELPSSLVARANEEEFVALNNIILKACEADARKRYATAAELRADLLTLQARLTGQSKV